MKEDLRSKIDGNDRVIFFEVVPPIRGENFVEEAKKIADILEGIKIDGINIPEIRNESRNWPRTVAFKEKTDTPSYGTALKSLGFETIINRCTVYENAEEQRRWLKNIWNRELENIVAVGGESGKQVYAGPSVTQFCDIALSVNRFLLGGITIPARRRKIMDEPERLLEKSRHGIEFFISQVLYESDAFKKLMNDYHTLCRKRQMSPKRLFISLAPVSSEKDIMFLKWLGVEIPHDAEKIFSCSSDVAGESMEICQQILEDILEFGSKLDLPLGVNVEHIMKFNTPLAVKMLKRLDDLYKRY